MFRINVTIFVFPDYNTFKHIVIKFNTFVILAVPKLKN